MEFILILGAWQATLSQLWKWLLVCTLGHKRAGAEESRQKLFRQLHRSKDAS